MPLSSMPAALQIARCVCRKMIFAVRRPVLSDITKIVPPIGVIAISRASSGRTSIATSRRVLALTHGGGLARLIVSRARHRDHVGIPLPETGAEHRGGSLGLPALAFRFVEISRDFSIIPWLVVTASGMKIQARVIFENDLVTHVLRMPEHDTAALGEWRRQMQRLCPRE